MTHTASFHVANDGQSAPGRFRLADKGHVIVRPANSEFRTWRKSLFFRSNSTPGRGSEVPVPTKDPSKIKTDYIPRFGAIAAILARTVSIIVIAKR